MSMSSQHKYRNVYMYIFAAGASGSSALTGTLKVMEAPTLMRLADHLFGYVEYMYNVAKARKIARRRSQQVLDADQMLGQMVLGDW
jgi:hypothetical protein